MGGQQSTTQINETLNDIVSSSVTNVVNESVVNVGSSIAQNQTLMNLQGATISGPGTRLDVGNLTAEAAAKIDFKATVSRLNTTDIAGSIATKVANDVDAKLKASDSFFFGKSETSQASFVNNKVRQIMENNVKLSDVQNCTSTINQTQMGLNAQDLILVNGAQVKVGDINLKMAAENIAECVMNSTTKNKVVSAMKTELDNAIKASMEKKSMIEGMIDSVGGPIMAIMAIIGIVVIIGVIVFFSFAKGNPAMQAAMAQRMAGGNHNNLP